MTKRRPGARADSLRFTTEKTVSTFARCPYSFCGKARYIFPRSVPCGTPRRGCAGIILCASVAGYTGDWLRNRTRHRPAPSAVARVVPPHPATPAGPACRPKVLAALVVPARSVVLHRPRSAISNSAESTFPAILLLHAAEKIRADRVRRVFDCLHHMFFLSSVDSVPLWQLSFPSFGLPPN